MLGQEELVEQAIDLEEPLTVERDHVSLDRTEPGVTQRLERRGESDPRVDAELLRKIGRTGTAEFELKNELSNEALIRRGCQRPGHRGTARFYRCEVGIEVVLILVVGTTDVPETRHPEAHEIGARPEAIAIDEVSRRFVERVARTRGSDRHSRL